MEDEKLAAYYDDLTRRGGGATRFKQGLGFSSTASSSDDAVPSRGSALPAASSFLSSFVRASSPSKTAEFEKQAELQSIQNKLGKKPREKARSRSPKARSRTRSPKARSRSRSPSRDKYREKRSRRRSRSRSRDRHSRHRSRSRDRRSRRRSRSRSHEYEPRRRNRSRSRERSKRHGSPAGRTSEKSKKGSVGAAIDYAKLIKGYDNMTPAERVKAKMKLQLSKTAANDETIGKGAGWERFEFNKDAPLDDEEIEAAEDDAEVVKHMGQSFRFSAVETKREEKLKAAHDEAMFGGSSYPPPAETDDDAEEESHKKQDIESAPVANLLNDQVLMKQQGSWRDRLRKP